MRLPLTATITTSLALWLGAGEASADVIFTLSGVTFDDGGTAAGTFTTNDALDALVGFDITTSPGADIGFHYTPATADSTSTSLPIILVLRESGPVNLLQLTFTGLTAAGAPIALGGFDSFEQGTTGNARRVVVSGSVVGPIGVVPEPSSLALAAPALLAGLAGWRWRRRKAA